MTDSNDFRVIAPGIAVSGKTKVSIPHPDPCWVIRNPEQTATRAMNNQLLIFSEEKNAEYFMRNQKKDSFIVKKYSWEELVDKFENEFLYATLDHKGETGFYQTIPIQKNI